MVRKNALSALEEIELVTKQAVPPLIQGLEDYDIRKPSVEEMMTTDDGTFDPLPPPQKIRNRIHQVGVQTIDHDEFAQLTGTISTDQTGNFPVTSRRGNKYDTTQL